MSEPVLSIRDLHVGYGNVKALSGVSFEVRTREIVTLIGANGAGKSTALRTISGLHAPTSGSVALEGRSLLGMKANRIARLGVAHAPEGRRILPGLTVEQNLQLGMTVIHGRATSAVSDLDRMYELFPALKDRRKQLGWSLSGGEQQMLSLGRALISRPRLLLLDEPSLGLAPKITQQLFRSIESINADQGVAILLVEQNAFMALNVAHRGYLLENGRISQTGTAQELVGSQAVRDAYLGG